MILDSSCSSLCPIHWNQRLNREWRYSWSSADRRCSNYIWVINDYILYKGASYIRGFMVYIWNASCFYFVRYTTDGRNWTKWFPIRYDLLAKNLDLMLLTGPSIAGWSGWWWYTPQHQCVRPSCGGLLPCWPPYTSAVTCTTTYYHDSQQHMSGHFPPQLQSNKLWWSQLWWTVIPNHPG